MEDTTLFKLEMTVAENAESGAHDLPAVRAKRCQAQPKAFPAYRI